MEPQDCYHCSKGEAYSSMTMSHYVQDGGSSNEAGITIYACENESPSNAYLNAPVYLQAKPGEEDDKKPEGLEAQIKDDGKQAELKVEDSTTAKLTNGGKSAEVSIAVGGNYNSWNFQSSFSVEPKEHELKATNQGPTTEIKKTAEDLKLEELIKSTEITGYA